MTKTTRFDATELKSGCKINLGLSITGLREDGYHLLDSVFYPLDEPHDTLIVRPADAGITVVTRAPGIDCEHNTLTRAWQLFTRATGAEIPIEVELIKGVPWGAGLGGGSADAACLLNFMARTASAEGCAVSDTDLSAIAAKVGADVPFFLSSRPARITGVGDVITPLVPEDIELPGRELVLVMPDIKVSTPWAYKAFDQAAQEKARADKGKSSETVTQITQNNAETLTASEKASTECLPKSSPAGLFVNDLEAVVFGEYPELLGIRDKLLQLGACAASMSGSGSSIYGLFTEHSTASAAASAMGKWRVQLCALVGM